ncbi:MAG: ABC transporter ATP-binding protein, partial [Solirubrobacteraceae bacterium]
ILLTTHDMDEAEKLCDQIAFLAGGRIVAEGTSAELQREFGGGLEDVFMVLTGRTVEDDEEEVMVGE